MVASHDSLSPRATRAGRSCRVSLSARLRWEPFRRARRCALSRRKPHSPIFTAQETKKPTKELVLTIVGILIVIILILLAIYLFRRVF